MYYVQQKYRADYPGAKQSNGGIPYYTKWMGGPTLSLIRDCPTEHGKRTVYIRGEADSFFSIPATYEYKRTSKTGGFVRTTITGYITTDDNGEYVFRPHTNQKKG